MTRLGPLFVDTISITLPVTRQSDQRRITEYLRTPNLDYRVERAYQRGRYSTSYWVLGESDFKVHLQTAPYRSLRADNLPLSQNDVGHLNNNWLRLEWNSSSTAAPQLQHFLLQLFDIRDLQVEILHGRVTRIDFALDIYRQKIDNILFARPRAKSAIYYGRSGRIETIYIGSPNSDHRFAIYNKNQEITERTGVVRGGGRIRIEGRMNHGYRLNNLRALPNPFLDLVIREYCSLSRISTDHTWQWFIDSCKLRGATAALAAISESRTRSNWRKKVRESEPPPWWDPVELWQSGRDQAIQRIGLWNISNDPIFFEPLELPDRPNA